MTTLTFKYTDFGMEETNEFREYVKNLIGYIGENAKLTFDLETDPMFDNKVVAGVTLADEDIALDVVNHFVMDREICGEAVPFSLNFAAITVSVEGSEKVSDFLTNRSFANLYERVDVLEAMVYDLNDKAQEQKMLIDKMSTFIQNIGADKFPDIVRALTDSMEFEGNACKQNINDILQRKVH